MEPSNNLRYLSIQTLVKIRENGYKSKFYKGHSYDKEAIEAEIKRKIESKKYRSEKWRV